MIKLKPIVIVGARMDGHAGVVLDLIAKTKTFKVIGFLDNTPEFKGTYINNIPVLGSSSNFKTQKFESIIFHIAIGDNAARGKLFKELTKQGYEVVSLIHPSAIVSEKAKIGNGCFIGAGAIINNGSIINDATIINTGSIIEHDNIIGFSAHMAPGSKTAGRVIVDELAFIGIGATILPDIHIGKAALIGAGSTVVKNVPAKTTVIGYAARKHTKNIYRDAKSDN